MTDRDNGASRNSEDIHQFSHALDRVVAGDAAAGSALDPGVLEVASTLASLRAASLSRRRDDIRDRVLGGSRVQWPQRAFGVVAGLAVIALVALAATMALTAPRAISPGSLHEAESGVAGSAHALTGNVLGEFYGCTYTDGPTQAQRAAAGDPNAYPTLDPNGPQPQVFDSLSQAAAAAGFGVYVPQVIPDGLEFSVSLVVSGRSISQSYTVLIDDIHEAQANPGPYDTLVIMQSISPYPGIDNECPVGGATLHEVTVRGISGMWLDDAPLGFRDGSVVTWDKLMWFDGGFGFEIHADSLTLEEALAVAESLTLAE